MVTQLKPGTDGTGKRRRPGSTAATIDKRLASLALEFEQLGLTPYEARVLLALLRMGTASGAELARASGVPRTSTYDIIEELTAKGLAMRVPSSGTAAWTAPERKEVFERLEAAQAEQLQLHRERARRAEEALTAAWPRPPERAVPYLQLVYSAARARRTLEELLAGAQSEVLFLSRPPYSWKPAKPNPAVLAAVGRGVVVRAIYDATVLAEPNSERWRAEFDGYVAAGVEARLVDHVPMKLVVFDRRAALVALNDPGGTETSYPSNLLVDHPGFVDVQVRGYEDIWRGGRPYPPSGLSAARLTDYTVGGDDAT